MKIQGRFVGKTVESIIWHFPTTRQKLDHLDQLSLCWSVQNLWYVPNSTTL